MPETQEIDPHQCVFREIVYLSGSSCLLPCEVCGTSPAQAMMAMDGDQLRGIVRRFLAEGEEFARQAKDAKDPGDRERYVGHALARDILAQRLSVALVDVAASPSIVDMTQRAGPRTAAAVRRLHVLESIEVGASRFSSCKADGYVSTDLTKDPCSTLKALAETDPPPVPPGVEAGPAMAAVAAIVAGAFVDHRMPKSDAEIWEWVRGHQEQITDFLAAAVRVKTPPPPPPAPKPVFNRGALVTALYDAIGNAYVDRDTPGWTLEGEAGKAADRIIGDAPVLDFADEATFKMILNAIASPILYAQREGDAVPGHQARAVIARLTRAAKT